MILIFQFRKIKEENMKEWKQYHKYVTLALVMDFFDKPQTDICIFFVFV